MSKNIMGHFKVVDNRELCSFFAAIIPPSDVPNTSRITESAGCEMILIEINTY